jgi:hypothetical protein
MYIQLETMKEITESEIRSLYPNTSFPTPFTLPEGFAVVFPTPSPTVTELQVAIRDGVEVDSKGNYVEKWLVKDMFSDYTVDEVVVTKAEQEAKYLADKAKALVPKEVTMRQARLALLDAGLLDDINTLLSQDERAKIMWEYATAVYRDEALVSQMQLATGMSDDQIDVLFIEASKL